MGPDEGVGPGEDRLGDEPSAGKVGSRGLSAGPEREAGWVGGRVGELGGVHVLEEGRRRGLEGEVEVGEHDMAV